MAIAFDAAANSSATTSSSVSWSHTCTGSDRVLVVVVNIRDLTPTTVTGITYNSVALTKLLHQNGNFRTRAELWYLVAPATGTNTVAVTFDEGPENACAGSVSFTGVDQSTPMDVAGGAGAVGPSATATLSITTVTDNTWLVGGVVANENSTITPSSGTTERWDVTFSAANGQGVGGHSTAAKTPAGSHSIEWTINTSQSFAGVVAALRPAGGAVATSILRQMLAHH